MFHHGGILQRLIKICAAWDRINLSLPNRRLKSGPRTRHEIKIKKRRINKNRFLVRPAKSGISGSVWTDHVDSSTVFFTAVLTTMNGTLIGLTTCLSANLSKKLAQNEAWRLKMVSNWWLLNFWNFKEKQKNGA